MFPALSLPRLVFGAGSRSQLPAELARLGIRRPLLISDRGLERAGIVATVQQAAEIVAAVFLDVPENPTARGADWAARIYRENHCDAVIALGGGSVLDTAKILIAMAPSGRSASELIGKPGSINAVVPLIAIPTTVGTGSESSPVAALHLEANGPAIGTRDALLVPRVALCDPDLARTLPPRLVAATGIDALSHCIEGFFAEPANPIIDALALDGIRRVFADIRAALGSDSDAARASLMAAAFAGGAAIHKGLGPAHAVALACGDQDVHHGTMIGVALPATTRLLARHRPQQAGRIGAAIGLAPEGDLADALRDLIESLGLPLKLGTAGYRIGSIDALAELAARSHFNRSSPYVPSVEEYRDILLDIAD